MISFFFEMLFNERHIEKNVGSFSEMSAMKCKERKLL